MGKTWRKVWIGVFCLWLGAFASLEAKEYVVVSKGQPAAVRFVHPVEPWELELSIPAYSHKLRIDSSPDIIYEGAAAGIRGSISHIAPLFMRAELSSSFANLDRRNSTADLDFSQVDFAISLGSTLGGGPIRFTPYLGLGVNWLRYEDSTGSTIPVEFSYGYFPLGIRLEFKVAPILTVGLDISLRLMFAGEVTLKYSDVNPALSDVTDDLDPRVGGRILLPVTLHLLRSPRGPMVSLVVTFYYEVQALESPLNASTIVINDMLYQNSGAFLGVIFHF